MINKKRKPIAITSGDPSSISPIITLKAWLKLKNTNNVFFVISDLHYLDALIKKLNLNIDLQQIDNPKECTYDVFSQKLPVLNINNYHEAILGVEDKRNSKFVLESIDLAVDLANNKQVHGIVTNPINKYLVNDYGIKNFYGHTDYIFNLSKLKEPNSIPIMLLSSLKDNVHVIPLTTHIPISKVAKHITKEKIINYSICLHKHFKKYYDNLEPTIYILGLNPHAGENGILGTEEIDIINPAISALNHMNINVIGPESADTIFNNKNRIILGMYHDQVLAPFKALYFNCGVNTTLNLGFIRTSPDHGTAFNLLKNNFDINKIDESSLIAAIEAIFSISK